MEENNPFVRERAEIRVRDITEIRVSETSNIIDFSKKRKEKAQTREDAIRKGIKKLADKLSWT